MKILQLCAYAATYEGNFMNSLFVIERNIKEFGYDTIYAFPETAKNLEWCKKLAKRTNVYFLPLVKARLRYVTYKTLKKIIKDESVDIVHSHFELYDVPAAVVCKMNTKLVWHIHDAVEMLYNKASCVHKSLYKLQYGFFSKKASIISVSDKHLDFVKKLGLKSKNTEVIANGTVLDRIKRCSVNKDYKYDFVIFAWEFDRKGGNYAIEAAKILESQNYKFKIAFVGTENTWENPIVKENEQKPWLVKHSFVKDVNELYNNARCFLHVSLAEGCSYALEEAIYAGLPIICSDIDENKFASDFSTVRMVKNRDADSIAVAMKDVIDNKFIVTEKMVDESREKIINNYSVEAWAKKIISLYMDE